MKLSALLKEVKAKQKLNETMQFEFETDAYGNLEIYSPNHEELLAVVDKESGNIDYNQIRMNDVQFSKSVKAQIMAAAERFLDDESDQSDSSSMYADRFSEAPERSDSSAPRMSTETDDYPFVSKKEQYQIFAKTFLSALGSAIEGVDTLEEAEENVEAMIDSMKQDLAEMAFELISDEHPMFGFYTENA
jgi:hypothetical protein